MSDDARLMGNALDAARRSPVTRHDVVEKMQRLKESGELGRDAGALADSIIDSLLGKQSPT